MPEDITPGNQQTRTSTDSGVGEMTTLELDNLIKGAVGKCTHHAEQLSKAAREILYPALLEMERRFNKVQGARNDIAELKVTGWHDYLHNVGITPDAFRKWKSRNAVNELESFLFPPKPKKPRRESKQGQTSELLERESDLLAKAGIRLAKTILNPLLTHDERAQKGQELSEQLVQAAESGVYEKEEPEAELGSAPVAEVQVPPAAEPSTPKVAAVAANRLQPASTESVLLPKSGDWSGLVASVNTLCGKHLKAVLSGLEPDVAANVFGMFAQQLARTHCHYEFGLSELRVTVNVLSRKASEAEKKKLGLLHGAA